MPTRRTSRCRPEGPMSSRLRRSMLTGRVVAGRKSRCRRKGPMMFRPEGRCRSERPMMFRPRESMLANRLMLTQGSMLVGRADDFPTGRLMPAGRANDFPTGRSMPAGRADEFPTGRSMNGGFQNARKSRKVNSQNPMRNRKFERAPERGTVRGLTMFEEHRNTGESRNFRNTGSSTQAEDTREPRHPKEGESKTDARSETGTDVR
jgi:hypothetical protein